MMQMALQWVARGFPLRLLAMLQFFLGLSDLLIASAERPGSTILLSSNVSSRARHSEGYCAMYDICGSRSDGKVLNCPYGSPPVKPDELLTSKIQSLCPTINGDVCCTNSQFDTLRSQVQQAVPFLVGCPACLRNFLNLFCMLTCFPDQSLFINVSSVAKANNKNMTVGGIDFYMSDAFGEGLYNSCKDVKFGTMNSRALDFVGGGAQNIAEWLEFIGRKAAPNSPGSPYAINFLSTSAETFGIIPLNVSTYSCGDASLSCSCGDCPSSRSCSDSVLPPSNNKRSCSLRFGLLKIKCVELAVAIIYIIFTLLFLGWAFFYPSIQSGPFSRTKLVLNVIDEAEPHLVNKNKTENTPLQIFDDIPQNQSGMQHSIVHGYMINFYRKYGTFVARRPTLVLCSSLSLVLLLCLGLIRFKVETRPEKLWVGSSSKAAEEKQFFDTHLAPFYRIEQLILATILDPTNGKLPRIATEENIKLLFEMQKKVDGIRAYYHGSMISLMDVCMKPLGQDCATQSILQYFKMDPKNYDDFGGVEHTEYCFEHFTSADSCMSAFKAPLDPSTVLGGFSGNKFTESSAFIVTYPINNAIDKEGNETGRAVAWEKAFIQLAKDELLPMVHSQNLTLSFSSESSIEEELKRESTADAITILISYIVMFVYISLTLGDLAHLSSIYVSYKVLLSLSGVVLVMVSVLGSVGFFSAVGIKSTLIIMEVIPFLVLAVGVDNMCILVQAVKRQPLGLPLEGQISNALVEVGPSITLASICEVLAFSVGSFIPMPACRVFSMFAALAVLLDFFLQVTAFVAIIVLDVFRDEERRICFSCIKTSSPADRNQGIGVRKPGLMVRYMERIHTPIVSIRGVKIVVVLVFLALALVSIVLCSRIEPGLEQKIVLPRNSYLQGYFTDLSKYLRIGPPLYFVVKNYNYSSQSRHTNQLCSISQCDSDSLLNEIAKASLIPESSFIAKPAASWLDDFLVWMSPEAFGCCRKFMNGSYCPPDDQPPCCSSSDSSCGFSETCKDCTTCFHHRDLHNDRPSTTQFREKLPWFLNALPSADCAKGGHGAYTNTVDLTGYENGIVQASEFRTYHTPLNKQVDYVNSLKATRKFSSKLSKSLEIQIFPYSVFYLFFEQYLDIWRTCLINLSVVIGAIFIVCLVITFSLWTSAIILLVLFMIVVDLLATSSWWLDLEIIIQRFHPGALLNASTAQSIIASLRSSLSEISINPGFGIGFDCPSIDSSGLHRLSRGIFF